MRVIVTGGRAFKDRTAVRAALLSLRPTVVVQGGAPGADAIAREWALWYEVPCETFAADWAKLGRKAGPARNAKMIAAGADVVLAFPGGRGTADCVAKARAAGIKVIESRL